jgi:hypothetical protein
VLSIVFGSLVTLLTAANLLGSQAITSLTMPGLGSAGADAMRTFMERTRDVMRVNGGLFLVMSIALIVIGVGQANYKAWAAKASVIWGIVALLVLVVMTVLNVMVVFPAQGEMMQQITRGMPGGNPAMAFPPQIFAVIGVVGNLVSYGPYPVIMMWIFRKQRVLDAMVN